MMTCCKEKAVFVAVYEEKPRKKRLTTKDNNNVKHHHHHHHHYHHHHLQIHKTNNGEGNNRRAELLSYSKHLRESSKASISPKRPKSIVASTSNNNVQPTITPASHVEEKQKIKKQSSWLDMNNIFKCFAISQAKKKVKKKRAKKSSESPAKKARSIMIMKAFNARTQKGTRRFFSKVMATIQKYR